MNVKILVSYHKPGTLLKGHVFLPIHVGRALDGELTKDGALDDENKKWLYKYCIGDDTGINISNKNRSYCELTALYWAWKNIDSIGDIDAIGFFHYRRHLCFDLENKDIPDRFGCIPIDEITDQYQNNFHINDSSIEEIAHKYDIVTVEGWSVKKVGSSSLYDHYCKSSKYLYGKDYDLTISVLRDLYPEYGEWMDKYNKEYVGYFTNIFIMKIPVFKEYMEWLFSILSAVERKIDTRLYNVQAMRVFGYLSEWLFGIWYTYQRDVKCRKSIELKRTFIKNTDLKFIGENIYMPRNGGVNICFATDNNYLKYLSVALRSVVEHADPGKIYNIYILVNGALDGWKELLCGCDLNNFHIELVNVRNYIDKFLPGWKFYESGHINVSAYFRLFAPVIFDKVDKLLYLDSDLVVEKDVSKLFEEDISSYLIGGIVDVETNRWYCAEQWVREYVNNVLKIDINGYINSGVCLMNLRRMREENLFENFKKCLENIRQPRFHDQDVLNVCCAGKIKYFDVRWNCEYHIPIWSPNWKNEVPAALLYKYVESRKTPWIVHFAGGAKPWDNLYLPMSGYFWKYARKVTCYELLFVEAIDKIFSEHKSKIPEHKPSRVTYFVKRLEYKLMRTLVPRKRNYYAKKLNLQKNWF